MAGYRPLQRHATGLLWCHIASTTPRAQAVASAVLFPISYHGHGGPSHLTPGPSTALAVPAWARPEWQPQAGRPLLLLVPVQWQWY